MEHPINNKIPSPQFLTRLSKEEQEVVAQLNSIRDFKKGDLLIRECVTPTASYFVVNGLVRKFRTEESQELTIDFYSEQGSIF